MLARPPYSVRSWASSRPRSGFACFFALNHVRGAGGAAIGLLSAAGFLLGLGVGGGLDAYASADPGVVWQAGAATALFVAGSGRSAT